MTPFRIRRRTVAVAAALLAMAGVGPVTPSSAADTGSCRGKLPTLVATSDGQVINGTDGDDVIIAWGFRDVIVNAGLGNDRICGDPAVADGGDGNDVIYTVGGAVVGGAGNDVVSHAGGTTDGGPDNDRIRQRQFGTVRGADGNDWVTAAIFVGVADPLLPPWETATPAGDPVFHLDGDAGADRLTVSAPTDGTTSKRCPACGFSVDGGDGRDAVGVRGNSARINLAKGTVRFAGTEVRPRDVEGAVGTAGPDLIVGDERRNTLSGKGGRDRILGGPSGDLLKGGAARDVLLGQGGLDGALGGGGNDKCRAELSQNCE
ncbi:MULTISPECIES: hypothetical protein [unclassified Nocardioides]|uniref:hypothetical protein n=1 Tax=unclassified Nocardioides TaxID=2615069 RepID=UPI003614E366